MIFIADLNPQLSRVRSTGDSCVEFKVERQRLMDRMYDDNCQYIHVL